MEVLGKPIDKKWAKSCPNDVFVDPKVDAERKKGCRSATARETVEKNF